MPLIHSKKPAAFKKNVATEMEAGKPQKQAVAIAYQTQRDSKAEGGEVERPQEDDAAEIREMIGDELMRSFEAKDAKGFMEAVEALVTLVTMESEDSEEE